MALPPQKFREAVFQILFSTELVLGFEEIIPFMMKELATTRKEMTHAVQRVQEILVKLPEIDGQIEKASTSYSFDRISRVEKTILRLAVFELFSDETIPHEVAIAEAIRICRKFGTVESAQFINAILDKIYKDAATNQPVLI